MMRTQDYAEMMFALDLSGVLAFAWIAVFAFMQQRRIVSFCICASVFCAALAWVVYPSLSHRPPSFMYEPSPPVNYGDH